MRWGGERRREREGGKEEGDERKEQIKDKSSPPVLDGIC